MNEPEAKGPRHSRKFYESIIVMGFAAVLLVLWVLSLSSVRARMATRAWESGNVVAAHRLASLATRQQPARADMWILQARCEEQLESPCAAALSYARAALAAGEQLGREPSPIGPLGPAPAAAEFPQPDDTEGMRQAAIHRALAAAAECRSVSTLATVFEALTVGLPSSPENRSGIWPGDPEVDGFRPTPEALATALPVEPELQFPWIEFFWRRQNLAAAMVAAERLDTRQASLPASGLWLVGRALLQSGRSGEAAEAFRQALRNDPGWVPAAVSLADIEAGDDAPPAWTGLPLSLETVTIEADVFDARAEVLLLATNGKVTFEVEPGPGTNRTFLALDIRGTPAYGRFPEITVFVDGTQVAAMEATDPSLPVVIEVPATGRVTSVSFVFANDWADESGDRNVFFSSPKLYSAN